MQEVDYEPQFILSSGSPIVSDSIVHQEVGEFINGTMGNNMDFDYTDDRTEDILADYEEMHGEPLQIVTACMNYLSFLVAAEAIEQAGSTDHDDINQALQDIQFPAEDHPVVQGDVEFRDDGELAGIDDPDYVSTAFMQVQDLETVHLAPEWAAQGEPQF